MHEHFYKKNNLSCKDKRLALKACRLKHILNLTREIFLLGFIKVCMLSCYLYEKNLYSNTEAQQSSKHFHILVQTK